MKIIQYTCDRCGKYKELKDLYTVTRRDVWHTCIGVEVEPVECHICTDCANAGTLRDLSYEAKPKEMRPV